MKKILFLTIVAVVALATTACNEKPPIDPPIIPDGPLTFTEVEGVRYEVESSSTIDYVELTFRTADFDDEGNSTDKGAALIIPLFTKPSATGVKTIASGTYNAASNATEPETFTYIAGNATKGSGVRVVRYDDKGQSTTTYINSGSFYVTRSSGVYTIKFNLLEGETELEANDFVGEFSIEMVDNKEYLMVDRVNGLFYDDYYDTGTYCWGLDMIWTHNSGKMEGIIVTLNMSTAYHFDNGQLQEGVYTAATNGAVGTYYQGVVEGNEAKGATCILIINGNQVPYLITEGTISIESSGANGYIIKTDLKLWEPNTNDIKRVLFKYEGEPNLSNNASKNRTWNGDIEFVFANYYGNRNRSGSDRWILQLSWPDGNEMRHYIVEIYAPQSGNLTLPSGTFEMAATTGQYAPNTMEPGHILNFKRLGTWFLTTSGGIEKVNPRPAAPNIGSITITENTDGTYDIVSYFEDDMNNKFNGSYDNGTVTVVDNQPLDFVVDEWNNNGVVFYNGPEGSRANNFRANLMNGTLYWDSEGRLQGAGMWLDLDVYTDQNATRYIPLGVYTRNLGAIPGTLGMFTAFYKDDVNAADYNDWGVTSGSAEVKARDGDTYTIEFDFGLRDAYTLKGTFIGELEYIDSSNSRVSEMLKRLIKPQMRYPEAAYYLQLPLQVSDKKDVIYEDVPHRVAFKKTS